MKIILIVATISMLTAACAPVKTTMPLASLDGWVQVLTETEFDGVPILAMSW